jgi:hypothetical protein
VPPALNDAWALGLDGLGFIEPEDAGAWILKEAVSSEVMESASEVSRGDEVCDLQREDRGLLDGAVHRDVSGIEFPVERRGAGCRVIVHDFPGDADEAVADDELGGMLSAEEVDEYLVESGQGPEGTFAGCRVAGEIVGFGYHQLAVSHARRDEPPCEVVAEGILHGGREAREGQPWLRRVAL